mmetsp:Transcript_16819/g.23251  ORF Transcript_16819/g.23251 Transcript_16819/m.23251 type:complete len:220 (-) Transcript_16819:254-913(-)
MHLCLTPLFHLRDEPSSGSSWRAGKVHGVGLPQELQLDKFILNIRNPSPSWTSKYSACDWVGVTCNAAREVTHLLWSNWSRSGPLNWESLPKTILHIDLSCNFFEGTVLFDQLPPILVTMLLQQNQFTGDVNLLKLPHTLEHLNIAKNRFDGTLTLHTLHERLSTLILNANYQLKGTINVAALPKSLCSRSWTNTQIREIKRTKSLGSIEKVRGKKADH